jgi:hypothetical protein
MATPFNLKSVIAFRNSANAPKTTPLKVDFKANIGIY